MSQKNFSEKAHALLNLLVRLLKHLFVHNGWIKLIAVLISLVVWAGLISQDENLTRNKTFQISISKTAVNNAKNNLNEKGYIITSDLEELLSNITLTAAVPQTKYENATQSAYNVQIDVSGINGTGEQELKLTGSDSSVYGKVVSISPEKITVEVEKKASVEISSSLSIQGMTVQFKNNSYYEGWYKDWYIRIPSNNIGNIVVEGAESVIDTINRMWTELDVENINWQEGTLNPTGRIYLNRKSDGELIDNSLLKFTRNNININFVSVRVTVLPTLTFETKDLVQTTGKPAEGYKVGEITISNEQKAVSVAASSEVLNQLDALQTDATIDVSGKSETFNASVKIQKPTDDCILSNETINVTVEIVPDQE